MNFAAGIAPQPFFNGRESGKGARDAYHGRDRGLRLPIGAEPLQGLIDPLEQFGDLFSPRRIRREKPLRQPHRADVQTRPTVQGASLAPDEFRAPPSHIHDQHVNPIESEPLLDREIRIPGFLLARENAELETQFAFDQRSKSRRVARVPQHAGPDSRNLLHAELPTLPTIVSQHLEAPRFSAWPGATGAVDSFSQTGDLRAIFENVKGTVFADLCNEEENGVGANINGRESLELRRDHFNQKL